MKSVHYEISLWYQEDHTKAITFFGVKQCIWFLQTITANTTAKLTEFFMAFTQQRKRPILTIPAGLSWSAEFRKGMAFDIGVAINICMSQSQTITTQFWFLYLAKNIVPFIVPPTYYAYIFLHYQGTRNKTVNAISLYWMSSNLTL